MECVKDCMARSPIDLNGECGDIADPWIPLFLLAKDCCSSKLCWLDSDECAANTNDRMFFTGKFYVGECEFVNIATPNQTCYKCHQQDHIY